MRHRHQRLPDPIWVKHMPKILFTEVRSDYRFYVRYNSAADAERVAKRINDMIAKWSQGGSHATQPPAQTDLHPR